MSDYREEWLTNYFCMLLEKPWQKKELPPHSAAGTPVIVVFPTAAFGVRQLLHFVIPNCCISQLSNAAIGKSGVLGFKKDKPTVYRIAPVKQQQVTFDKLLDEVSSSCGVDRAQVKASVEDLMDRMTLFMEKDSSTCSVRCLLPQ